MSRTLYGLKVSPWTDCARWALDHHGIVYGYHEHVPMIGELLLRRKAGTKKATVPLLEDGDAIVMGSFAIAKHAESIGRAAPLFPRDRDGDVAHWVDVAERLMRVGRARGIRRSLASKETLAELAPDFVPGALRGPFGGATAMALRFLAKKYEIAEDIAAEVDHVQRPLLDDVRRALGGAAPYLLGVFSYADIAIACSLQSIEPPARSPLGPATRAAWRNEALKADYADLLAWRDGLVGKHR